MLQLAKFRRPRRFGEWTEAKAVTFIVTLAARRSVTLAARAAGMSRKAAYALRARDPNFAAAWDAAYRAGSCVEHRAYASLREGDKANGLHNPPFSPPRGNSVTMPPNYHWFYEQLAKWRGESKLPPLARAASLP